MLKCGCKRFMKMPVNFGFVRTSNHYHTRGVVAACERTLRFVVVHHAPPGECGRQSNRAMSLRVDDPLVTAGPVARLGTNMALIMDSVVADRDSVFT
jgi:hypothetical protein